MDWTQFIIFFLGIFGLWLWQRSESNADRREIIQMIRSMEQETKEFHNRLYSLELRNARNRIIDP
jgi:hypothetical protein